MAITRVKLSASTNGRGISLATGAPTTIHTSTTAASTSDEMHVWVSSNGTATATMYIFVGTTGTGDLIRYEMPHNDGLHLLVPGLFLTSGLILYGQAGDAGAVAYGFVNRLTTGA
jgi:hypothetical protein